MTKKINRCAWLTDDPLYIDYHDCEWGVPLRDDQRLFEFLLLEGAQAGLSWLTILRKRENYRRALHGFDPQRIARYGDKDIQRLMQDSGIVRNRLKIESVVKNARGYLQILEKADSFADFIWQFSDGRTITNRWSSLADIPSQTPASQQMSKALKKRGFNFVGPTICYAFMQATGMVNDHTTDCFRHAECRKLAGR